MKLFPFHLIEVLTSTCFYNSLQGIQEHDVEVALNGIRFTLDQCTYTHTHTHTKYISFIDNSSIVIPFLFIHAVFHISVLLCSVLNVKCL